ncbi:MAG: YihY family inner membrane protein [Planctomycetaceae bacterium]|nr:YihY family inner membrane protein [Planctomycetaceae bacterium]
MRKFINLMIERLGQAISQPRDELDRWQRTARYLYDLGRCGLLQLNYDRAPQMAGELAFRTLFSLLPVMVVATVVVKAMGMESWFVEPLDHLLAAAGLTDVRVVPRLGTGVASENLDVWLQQRFQEASQVNVAAIGWVGVLVTIYAAIGLVVSVENSFNTIYRVQRGRSWTRRVPMYWFMLTVGPLVLVLGAYLNNRIDASFARIEVWSWVSSLTSMIWSLFILWVVMLLVYLLLPNTQVKFKAAFMGALVAALLLEIGKRTFGAYLQNALSISQLYGSLGLVPLFMFWVYLMWLVVLFGLEVSAITQAMHGGRFAVHGPLSSFAMVVEPTTVVLLTETVARNFEAGESSTVDDLVDATSLPKGLVEEMAEQLTKNRILHEVAGSKPAYTLARAPDQVSAAELIQVGYEMVDQQMVNRSALTDRLRLAQKQIVQKETLASLLAADS